MPDQPEAAVPTSTAPKPTPTSTAIPVVTVTPDDPILQAILAALNTALAAIHAWGSTGTSS